MLLPSSESVVNEFDWGSISWFASGAQGNSNAMTIGACLIYASRSNPRHRHPNCEEVLHLHSGRLIHSLGDEKIEMNPGDTITIPAGVAHNAEAVGEENAYMFIAFSSHERQFEPE